jgi:uncharacterized protein (TIGR00730 family)
MFLHRIKEYLKFLKSLALTNFRLIRGMWKLTKLPQPAITIFGSSRLQLESVNGRRAMALGKKLALGGFSVITGGGPGIMEAANRGAFEAATGSESGYPKNHVNSERSVGIGLTRLNPEKVNRYVQDYIEMRHFFARKWLLVRYSVGFVAFPGGFGTMDETWEVLTLIQTERMICYPVVLIDKEYWGPLYDIIRDGMLKRDLIKEEDKRLITLITDDIDEAYEAIVNGCREIGFDGKK